MIKKEDIQFFYVGSCEPNKFLECQIAYWLWRTIPFVLLAVGSTGNVLNIVILSRKQMKKYSTSVLLLILAFSDLTLLWTNLLPETVFAISRYRVDDQGESICRLRFWVCFTAGGLSVWILALLTVERVCMTKAPVYSRGRITPRNVFIACMVTFAIIACLNGHMIYGFTIDNAYDYLKNFQNMSNMRNSTESNHSESKLPRLPCGFVSRGYRTFFENDWGILMLIFYALLPAIVVIIGNINIAVVVNFQRARMIQIRPMGQLYTPETDRTRSARKMLFILSFMFLVTTMPYCIYYVVRGQLTSVTERQEAKWQLRTVLVDLLLWCNFTFNFFFYFVSGTLFKQEWKRITKACKSKMKIFRKRENH